MTDKQYFNQILSQKNNMPVAYYKAIDWNKVEDMIDKLTWEKLTEQFWLDTRIPVSNDLDDWRTLSMAERDVVAKAFGGLTLLDTLQSEEGAALMKDFVRTQHEEAVWNNIQFMESVHAKSRGRWRRPRRRDGRACWTGRRPPSRSRAGAGARGARPERR